MTERQLSLWTRLSARLFRATRGFGEQALLAKRLGVTRQALNGWLSGAALPTAENTLQLLKWVEAEEAKQTKSSPGRVSPLPGRMTRKRKSTSNEKPKSGRSKN
jgi:transcriptional regulator with XRE-family HTH domain